MIGQNIRKSNDAHAADALRVREQFAQIQSRRSPDIERRHLSEDYELAGKGEGLFIERYARINLMK